MISIWWRSEIVESEQIPEVRARFEAKGWIFYKLMSGNHLMLVFYRHDKPKKMKETR